MEYAPRYLAGILLFNEGDFFEAHEVWEDLWHELTGPDRRFVQGLIQVAVGFCHHANGNLRGATKLYQSSRDYLQPFLSGYWGLDVRRLFAEQEAACVKLFTATPTAPELDLEKTPRLVLDPPPSSWPDARAFLPDEEEH